MMQTMSCTGQRHMLVRSLIFLLSIMHCQSSMSRKRYFENGTSVVCVGIVCPKNHIFVPCTEGNGRNDTCRPCPDDRPVSVVLFPSSSFADPPEAEVCKDPMEECRCFDEAVLVNPENCNHTLNPVCRCDVNRGYFGPDANACELSQDDICKAPGYGLMSNGSCSKCADGFYKDSNGFGECQQQPQCLSPYVVDDPGDYRKKRTCRLPISTLLTSRQTTHIVMQTWMLPDITKTIVTETPSDQTTDISTDTPTSEGFKRDILIGGIAGIVVVILALVTISYICIKMKRRKRRLHRGSQDDCCENSLLGYQILKRSEGSIPKLVDITGSSNPRLSPTISVDNAVLEEDRGSFNPEPEAAFNSTAKGTMNTPQHTTNIYIQTVKTLNIGPSSQTTIHSVSKNSTDPDPPDNSAQCNGLPKDPLPTIELDGESGCNVQNGAGNQFSYEEQREDNKLDDTDVKLLRESRETGLMEQTPVKTTDDDGHKSTDHGTSFQKLDLSSLFSGGKPDDLYVAKWEDIHTEGFVEYVDCKRTLYRSIPLSGAKSGQLILKEIKGDNFQFVAASKTGTQSFVKVELEKVSSVTDLDSLLNPGHIILNNSSFEIVQQRPVDSVPSRHSLNQPDQLSLPMGPQWDSGIVNDPLTGGTGNSVPHLSIDSIMNDAHV